MRLSAEERLSYQKKEPIAVYGLSNSLFGCISIIDIIYGIEDYVVWYDSQVKSEKRKIHVSKIYYSENSNYFKPYGSMYINLSECLRVFEL